jgi:leader peptidase (prepilin peptidase)/N-methyltransferase
LAFGLFAALHAMSPRWMGYGDVRLAGLLGGYLGWLGLAYVPVGLFVGFLLGALTGIALVAAKRMSRRGALPFGPFLAAGALTAVLWGEPLIAAWLGRL